MSGRAPPDRYDTPPFAVAALLRELPELRGRRLFDPCSGNGQMAQAVAKGRFAEVITNDIDPRTPTPNHHDLRKRWMWESVAPDWCVTNPPFCLVGETFNLALDYSRKGVALLVRLSVLEVCKGRERIELYPPDRMIVLPRIKFRGQSTDKVDVCVDDLGAARHRATAPSRDPQRQQKDGTTHHRRSRGMMAEGESHGGEEPAFSRPTIIVDHELARMGEEALLALSMCPDIYQRNDRLVQVVSETGRKKGCLIREPGAPAIEAIQLSQLHLILSAAADWRKYGRGDHLVPTIPHDKVVKGVFEKGRYPESLRRLESVIETPTILADGRVIQTPGYDEETGLLYIQPPDLVGHTVAEHPNREDVEEARDLLLNLVCDFCFRDETHRSAWIAGVLTYFARFAIPA